VNATGDLQEAIAVQTFIDLKIDQDEQKQTTKGCATAHTDRPVRRTAMALGLLFAVAALTGTLSAQVPAVVATEQLTYASGQAGGNVALDACGNVYLNENNGSSGLVRISAATGTITTVVANNKGYNGGTALYMDRAKKNLYVPDPQGWYSSYFLQIPINNCVPGSPTHFAASESFLFGYYWGTAQDISSDAAGNVYYTTTASNDGKYRIIQDAYNASAGTYATGTVIYNSGSTYINYIASDAAGNIYFSTSKSTIQLLKAPYTAAPTTFATGFGYINGLTFDAQGNLFVSDNGTGIVYVLPYSSTLGGPNPANQTALASVSVPFKVAVDANENIYLSNYYPGLVELKAGGVSAAPTVLGKTSGSFGISYMFNTSVTPTSITAVNGAGASGAFSAGTGSCTIGKTYSALTSCTQYASFTPTAVGLQTGAIVFSSAAGGVTTSVSGVGEGAELTIDPGTVANTSSSFPKPTGVTYDSAGNVWVLDATNNTLTEFASGGAGAGTVIPTGTVTLKAPNSVAVDNVGNVFIADTGNSQIVEIPIVSGVLNSAGTFVLPVTVKSPQGIATDGSGSLYIADTGDNKLIYIPNVQGTLSLSNASTFGSLSGPSAVTVDPIGNVYVAETGNNDLLEFQAPLASVASIKVASGFSTPTALATDASGSVFVVDSGSGSIFRFPSIGGNLGTKTLVGSTVTNPYGVATDPSGNLYVTDATDGLAVLIQRVTTALQFGGWNVGSTSTPVSATLNSSGNTSLTFSTPSYKTTGNTAAGFTVTNDGCAGTSNLPGNSCQITATFTPPVLELNAQENLVLQSNAADGTPTVELVGTGAQTISSTLSIALTSPAGATTLNAGQAVSFTATAVTAGNVPVPNGGKVKFYVNGNQVGTVATTNGAALLTLPNGLPSGNAVIVSAVYGGTVVGGTQYYSGSSAQISEDVIALPDTLSMTITAATLWNNPLSANDNPANAKGPALNLIATVSPSSATIPTGTVSFYAGTSLLGIAQVAPGAGGTFQASLVTTALRAGSTTQVEDGSFITNYSLNAVYSGDNTYYGSTSPSVAIAIVSGPATPPACATASPATCYNNKTGAFYTLTPTNPTITATTTTAGGPSSGSTTMTITSYGGWNGILNFTCSGLPAFATCAPYPGYPTGVPSTPSTPVTPTTFSFIIDTNVTPVVPTGSNSMVWWVSGIGGLMLLMLRRRVKQMGYLRSGHLLTGLGAVLLLSGSMLGMGGCGTQGYGYITPAGSWPITVNVAAAQLVPGSTNGSTYLPDPNPTSFQITLIVK
jgi:sugar lactone lactonase YvrE